MVSKPQTRSRAQSIVATAARRFAFVLALTILAGFSARPAHANASLFVNSNIASCTYGFCTAASQFGVTVGLNDALTVTGSTNILNDIALDNGGKLTTNGTVNVGASGNAAIVDFADTTTSSAVPCTSTGCTGPNSSSYSTGTKVWGGTTQNTTLVDNAVTQFTDLVTYWNAQSGSSRGTPLATGAWNIDKSGSTSGMHVFSTTNYNTSGNITIGCGAATTNNTNLACDASDIIVILLSGTAIIDQNIQFAAASGLTADQLVFVVNSTSNTALTIGANATRTVFGDFLVANGGFTLGNTGGASNTTLTGRIFANSGNNVDTINHNVTLNNLDPVPEPGTWAMMAGGVVAMIYAARRRKRR